MVPASHYYTALFGGPIRVAPYATYGTATLASGVAIAMNGRAGALMANHGAVVAGDDLPAAVSLAAYLEYVCDVHLRALSSGRPVRVLPDEEIAAVATRLASYGQEPG